MTALSYLQQFDGVELAVRRNGKGVPLVWGHGLMGSMKAEDQAALWDWSDFENLVEVVRYDARGHGNSDGSYDPDDYRWEQMAGDMLAIARSVCAEGNWPNCVLGGLSMGCATAVEAARQGPGQVSGLVLVLPPTGWDTRPRQAAIYRRLSWVSGLLGAAPYRMLDWLPIPVREDGRSRLALHTARGLALANPLQVQAALRGAALSDMPELDVLAQLDVPTLILAWENDTAHPVSSAEELAQAMPDVRDLVICHPGDISDWLGALESFLVAVTARAKRRRKPRKRRAA